MCLKNNNIDHIFDHYVYNYFIFISVLTLTCIKIHIWHTQILIYIVFIYNRVTFSYIHYVVYHTVQCGVYTLYIFRLLL